ncbi:MAG: hypothetical protein NVSMB31_16940 [Vulcanimicrobiaceae bacterium]
MQKWSAPRMVFGGAGDCWAESGVEGNEVIARVRIKATLM